MNFEMMVQATIDDKWIMMSNKTYDHIEPGKTDSTERMDWRRICSTRANHFAHLNSRWKMLVCHSICMRHVTWKLDDWKCNNNVIDDGTIQQQTISMTEWLTTLVGFENAQNILKKLDVRCLYCCLKCKMSQILVFDTIDVRCYDELITF